jgi:hypothetical protein
LFGVKKRLRNSGRYGSREPSGGVRVIELKWTIAGITGKTRVPALS